MSAGSHEHSAISDPKNQLASAQQVQSWFKNAMGNQGKKPDLKRCATLAREIQITVNRQNNKILRQCYGEDVPLVRLKDVSPKELVEDLEEHVRDAARHLLYTMTKLQEFKGENVSIGLVEAVTYGDIAQFVSKMGVLVPKKVGAREQPYTEATIKKFNAALDRTADRDGTKSFSDAMDMLQRSGQITTNKDRVSKRGRPYAVWRGAGREIVKMVRNELRKSDQNKRVADIADEVGAAAISWAFGIDLTVDGLRSGLRDRNRSKSKIE